MSISLINAILSKVHNTTINLPDKEIVPHPHDAIQIRNLIQKDKDVSSYEKRYEPFELRSNTMFYTHICRNSVDVSNDNFLEFDTDININNSIMIAGASTNTKFIYNDQPGIIKRRIILPYRSIASLEFVYFTPE